MKWQTLCEVIRLERLRLRMKQSDVGKKSGVNPSTIGGWENGNCCPMLDKFLKVLDVLGLELKIVRKEKKQ